MEGFRWDLGGIALAGSPADFGKLIADETEKWGKVVKFSGAKPDPRNAVANNSLRAPPVSPVKTATPRGGPPGRHRVNPNIISLTAFANHD